MEVTSDLNKSSFHGTVEAKARPEGGMREGKELKTANTDHSLEFFCHEDQRNKGRFRKVGSRNSKLFLI